MKTKRTVLSVFGALALVVALSGCNMLSLRPAETAQIRVSAAQQMNAASGFFGTLRDVERIEVRILLDPSTDSTQTPVADMTELVKLILTGDNGWTAVADSVPTMTRLVFIAEAIGPAGPYIEGQLGFGDEEMDIAIDGAPFNDPEEVVMFTGLSRTTITSGAARVAFTLRANQGGVAQVPRIESIQVSLNGIAENFQGRGLTDYHIRVGFAPYDNAVMDPERWWYRIWDPQQGVRADQNEIGPNDTALHSRATGQFVVNQVPTGNGFTVTIGGVSADVPMATGQFEVVVVPDDDEFDVTIDGKTVTVNIENIEGGNTELNRAEVARRITDAIVADTEMPVTATRSGNKVILTATVITSISYSTNATADSITTPSGTLATDSSLTKEDVANRIASAINTHVDASGASVMPVTATRSGNRVILTAKVTGVTGEVAFETSASSGIVLQDLSGESVTKLTRQGRSFNANAPGWFTASDKASFARPWGSTLVSNTGRASDNNEVFFKYLFPTPPNRFSDALGNPLPTVLVDGEYRLGTYGPRPNTSGNGAVQLHVAEEDSTGDNYTLTFKAYDSNKNPVNVVYTYTGGAWNSPDAPLVSVTGPDTFTTYNQFGGPLPTVTRNSDGVPQWIVEDYQSNYWIEVMNPQHNMLRRAFIMNRGIENDTLRFAPAVSAKMEADDTAEDGYVRFTAIDGDGDVFDTTATGTSYNRLVWIVLPHGNAKVGSDNKRWMMYGNLTNPTTLPLHQDVQDLLDSLDARFEDKPNAINVAAGILSGDTVGAGGLVTGTSTAIVSDSNDVRKWTSTGWETADDPKNIDDAAILEFDHQRYFDSITAEGARIILLAFNEHFFTQNPGTGDFIRRPFFYTSFDVSGSTFEFCEVLGDWGTCPGGD